MVKMDVPPARAQFQGSDAQEMLQFYFRQHWIRLLWPLLRTVFFTALIVLAGWAALAERIAPHAMLITLALLFILCHLLFLGRLYRHFLTLVIVTDRKVHYIKKTLLSVNDQHSIDFHILQNVLSRQVGVVQSLFGYGSLILDTRIRELRVHFVPRIGWVYGRIMELRQQNILASMERDPHS